MDHRAGGRLDLRISPSDVGKRVSVRRVVASGTGRPAFSDTVGVLTSWTEGVLSVTRRTGESVRIPEAALVAGKVVPPAPARRPLAAPAADGPALRRIASDASPAAETERLGDWLLRASGGFTRGTDSVLAHGDPGLPLARALERVRSWYAARGLPALLQLADAAGGDGGAADRELDDAAAALGWTAEARTFSATAPLAPLADAPGAERVVLERTSGPARPAGGQLPDTARAVLAGGGSVWFARTPGDGGTRPAAVGRMSVEGRWAVVTDIEVAPEQRRRGLATAVTAALAARALAEGAAGALLQVEADNAPALALCARLGFTLGPSHHYRRAPGD